MSESMNIEKNENLVAIIIFGCLLVLKICILVALFFVYSENNAAVQTPHQWTMLEQLKELRSNE